MINIYVFIVLLIIIFNNYLLIKFYGKISINLLLSIILVSNTIFIVFFIELLRQSFPEYRNLDLLEISQMLSIETELISCRNSIIIFNFGYLTYGLYSEYSIRKKKIFLLFAIISFIITSLMLFLSFLAGGFLI